MSDDERTVEADESTMAELRRLAAAAREASAAPASTATADDDMTVIGGSDSAEEIRRLAAEARASLSDPIEDDATMVASGEMADEIKRITAQARAEAVASGKDATAMVDDLDAVVDDSDTMVANEDVMAQIREMTAAARSSISAPESGPVSPDPLLAPPSPSERVDMLAPDDPAPAPHTRQPEWTPPVPPPAHAEEPQVVPKSRPTVWAGSELGGVRRQNQEKSDGGWQPPDRMVMPDEVEKKTPEQAGPWKAMALVLAGVVVALVLLIATGVIGGGSNGDQPVDDETPVEDGEPADVDGTEGE